MARQVGRQEVSVSQASEKPSFFTALKKFTSTGWFAALLFLLCTVILFNGFFFSDMMLHSSDQMGGIDSKVLLKESLVKDHQFPWWEPSRLGGMPTVETLFLGEAFYLPSVVLLLFTSVAKYISLKMISHIFLAGLFFYLMLKKGFKMSQLVSITGALFYMFNPQFFSHIYPGHDGKMFVITWLPFIIWHLKVLMERPNLLSMSLVSIGITMCILSPQIQMTYFMLWGAGLYWITAVLIAWFGKKDRKRALTLTLYFCGAVGLGLGLGALQIFPSIAYVNHGFSVRGVEKGFEYASSWSLHWPEFFSLWVPELVNSLDYYWGQNPFKLNSEYAGLLPVLLSIGAVAFKPKNPWRILWASVAVLAALFALGAHSPVFRIAYAVVPGVKKFRAASMIMYWFSFSTIILSALFIKDLANGYFSGLDDTKKKKAQKGLLIAAGCALALTLLFSMQGFVKGLFTEALMNSGKDRIFELNFGRNFLPFLWLWFVFALAAIALVYVSLSGKVSPAVLISALLAIGLVDTLRIDTQFIKLVNPKPYFFRDATVQKLDNEMKKEPFRVFSLPGTLPNNGEGIVGLEGLGDFNDNELHWYREFRGDQQSRNFLYSLVATGANGQPYLRSDMLTEGNPFLDLANVRYLLARNGSQIMPFENRNALGRISFVHGDTVMDSAAVPQALLSGGYDYRKTVALTVAPALPDGFNLTSGDAVTDNTVRTTWQKYTPNYRKATVTTTADGFLRIAEVFYPSWEIRIDGKKSAFYRADLCWMAVPVTAGNHTVEMRAHSAFFGKYVKYSLVSVIVLAGCLAGYFLVQRKKTVEPVASK